MFVMARGWEGDGWLRENTSSRPLCKTEKEPLVEWGKEDFEQCSKFAGICLKDAGVFTNWKLFCCRAMAVQ